MGTITRAKFGRVAARKKRRRKIGIIFLSIIALIIIIFASPLFKLHTIEVEGNFVLSSDYVVEMSGLEKGKHLIFTDFSAAKDALKKTPYISSPKISYTFPNKLTIKYQEKMPIVYFSEGKKYVGINSDGYVADVVDTMKVKCPMATGIKLSTYTIGSKPEVKGNKKGQIDCLIQVATGLTQCGLYDKIAEINVEKITDITLISREGLIIKCGDSSDLNYKFAFLKEVMPNTDANNTLDISNPGMATVDIE